jgi:hypothetical protein
MRWTKQWLAQGLGVLLTCGCQQQQTIDPTVANRIALCSAGIGWNTSVSAQVELAKAALGGSVSAGLEQRIKGAVFAATQDDDARTRMYDSYIRCITGETAKSEYLALLEDRSAQVVRKLIEAQVPDTEVAALSDLIARHIGYVEASNMTAAHEVYRSILDLLRRTEVTYGLGAESLLYSPIV